MITCNNTAPEILFTCPTLTVTYALTIIWISGTMLFQLICFTAWPAWTGFYTWKFQPCQLSGFYPMWVSQFQCKSHGLMATQANLTGSPLCCVNTYWCHSNDAIDTDFLPPCREECGVMLEMVAKFCLPQKRAAYTHKLCKQRLEGQHTVKEELS